MTREEVIRKYGFNPEGGIDPDDVVAYVAAAVAAESERWRGLLLRALPMLREHAEYAANAPVWHCTGYEHNTLSKLIPEIEAALGPNE